MHRTPPTAAPWPATVLACAGVVAGATAGALVLLAPPVAGTPDAAAAELHVDARCRIVGTSTLEPLGELDDERVLRARADCTAEGGPVAGARLEADWTWAVERRAIEAGETVWRTRDATLTLPSLDATLRRTPDGGWIVGARGTVSAASGRAAGWVGLRYVLVARIDGVDEVDADGH